jgi:SulP family sulfate permease
VADCAGDCRAPARDAIVLLATLLLTIFRDLTEGILVGFALGTALFMHRMSETIRVEGGAPLVNDDKADTANGQRTPYDSALAANSDVVVYRISGAFFFGAAATVGAVLERIADRPKTFVLDFSDVPFLDSTAARAGCDHESEPQRRAPAEGPLQEFDRGCAWFGRRAGK